MPAKPASPSLIHNRDFMLLWTGQAVSVLGSRISSIAFPLLVLAITGSLAKAGLVGFAGTIPYLVFQLPAGGFIDRWDRKRTMIVRDGGRALALASIPVALWLDKVTMMQLAAVAFVEGTLFVFFQLAEQSALPHVVPHEQIPTAIAQNEARTPGAALARPADRRHLVRDRSGGAVHRRRSLVRGLDHHADLRPRRPPGAAHSAERAPASRDRRGRAMALAPAVPACLRLLDRREQLHVPGGSCSSSSCRRRSGARPRPRSG